MKRSLCLVAIAALGAASLPRAVAGFDQAAERTSGIYVQVAGQTGEPSWQRLNGVMVEDVEVSGVAKSMLTGGFLRPKVSGSIPGAAATQRFPSGDLRFEFRFSQMPSGRQATMEEMMAMYEDSMNALPVQAKRPNEFTLVQVEAVEGRRPTNGKKSSIKFKEQKIADRVYLLTPNAALPSGEYLFAFGRDGAAGLVWDFAIDAAR
jgi:hypothetical protein